MFQRLIRIAGHAAAHVFAQVLKAHHAVLEKVVVLDLGMVKRHDPVEIPVFPTQVITHDRLGRGLGLLRAIILGVHKGLDVKKPSLPNFGFCING
jgi:hypothetical protein